MKKFTLIAIVSICSVNAFAQLAPADTSTKVISLKEEVSPSAPAESNFNNVVRWNLIEVGRGIFSIGYERRISNYFSADIQVGISSRDYGGDVTSAIFDVDGTETDDGSGLFPSSGSGTSYKAYGAFCYMIGLRIYPFGRGNLEGFYVEPHYYSKKWDYDKTITNDNSGEVEELTYIFKPTETDAGIKCGWQFQAGEGHFYFNPYVGLALRSQEKFSIEDTYDNISNPDDYLHGSKYHKKKIETKTGPGILLGLNMGIAF
jgi:hypothetical protein